MKIHHIAISVRDLEKSVNFYKDIFNFTEVKRFTREDLGGKAAFIKLGDIQIELWEFDNQIENQDDFSNLNIIGIKHIAFAVDDINKIYQELKLKNIEISEPKIGASGGKYCFLKDLDNFLMELYEEN